MSNENLAGNLLGELRSRGVTFSVADQKLRYEAPTGVMTPDILDRLRANKAELLALLEAEQLRPRKRDTNRVALSPLQERLWFLEKLEPNSSAYIMPGGTRLRGELQADALERACAELVKRHEVLRTTFEETGGTVVQLVHDNLPLRWEKRDLSRVPAAEKERIVKEQANREATTPFDLRRGPLFRAKLLKLDDRDHVLLITMHHIVSDGWSVGIMVKELSALYAAFCTGAPSPLPALAVQYGDYALWDRQHAASTLPTKLAFWKKHLEGAPAALDLPTDFPRPATQKHRGAHVVGEVPTKTAAALRDLAQRHGATMYMTLLSAFSLLLGRSSGQHDVVVATPVVNRALPETEAMIGFFMNTLAMRVDVGTKGSFEDLLRRVRETSLDAYANQDVPFERIVQELNPVRDTSRNPIAQVSLNVLNLPDMRLHLDGIASEPLDVGASASKFDMTLYVNEGEQLRFDLVYDAELFDAAHMSRFLQRFTALLGRVAENPAVAIDAVSLVVDEERKVLPDPNAPLLAGDFRSIASRFDEHARSAPDAPAVRDGRRTWTYGELARRADQVAHWLAEHGVRSGDVVALFAERNALTVWGLLGIVKAGAAFMLLDAEYPTARLVEQLRIAKPVAWINSAESVAPAPDLASAMPGSGRVLDLLDKAEPWSAMPATSPAVATTASTPAYVVFTSGTSGGPKAIAGSHGPLSHFVEWHARTHELGASDRFSALSGLAHDPFLRDVFTPLSVGGSVCVPPADLRLEPDALAAWLAREGITACHLTPSLGEVLVLARGAALPALRYMFFAGEALRSQLVDGLRKVAPAARFVNFYGATETPQAMGYYPVPDGCTGLVPVGRGIEGVQLLVLDGSGGLAAVDEPGEICVRTPHLATGYVDGDARGFGTSPFTKDANDRVYRTGDRGRYLPDGNVQTMGRLDNQVKVRGFRVELAEVTDALRAEQGVQQAAVILDEKRRALVGYVVGAVDEAALKQQLRKRLPDYMVPGTIVKLETLPLTPNGKLDLRALPAPEAKAAGGAAGAGAGSNETADAGVAAAVTEIWKDVLGADEVGLHDNFFDLGGHSLMATQLAVRLGDEFAVEVTVRIIFEAPTVAELTNRIVAMIIESSSDEDVAAATKTKDDHGG